MTMLNMNSALWYINSRGIKTASENLSRCFRKVIPGWFMKRSLTNPLSGRCSRVHRRHYRKVSIFMVERKWTAAVFGKCLRENLLNLLLIHVSSRWESMTIKRLIHYLKARQHHNCVVRHVEWNYRSRFSVFLQGDRLDCGHGLLFGSSFCLLRLFAHLNAPSGARGPRHVAVDKPTDSWSTDSKRNWHLHPSKLS